MLMGMYSMACQKCKSNIETVSAMVGSKYYPDICRPCLSMLKGDSSFSSGFQGFDRRRTYEDYAQDTVQPWDANGKPRLEFLRLYPAQAAKTYDKDTLEQLKRQL
jgi:hypothetical protein